MQGNTACILVFNCNVKHDWVADITARLGVVAFDKALVYVKGGAAWTDGKYSVGNSITIPPPGILGFVGTLAANASASNTPVGGLLGMGIEYGFLPNWSAKIEYNFIDFGTQNVGSRSAALWRNTLLPARGFDQGGARRFFSVYGVVQPRGFS